MINARRIQAGIFKFSSTAPDVQDQDDDPGVPLANGICQHCGLTQDLHHHTKGALIKLDIGYIGAEQERDLQRICVTGGIELTVITKRQ
jgi:hypothetical protein